MSAEAVPFASVIESLADGSQIDWTAVEAKATDSNQQQRYGNLRLIARLAELHRTLALDASAETPNLAAAAPLPPCAAGDRWGHLVLADRIGAGAFGEVYRARDAQLDIDVALKIMRATPASQEEMDRFLGEARTLARVRHHNVVIVHGADIREGRAGLWMELVKGQTLESWLTATGIMGAVEVTGIGQALCRALAAVHAAELIHGDVKAQNVMREEGGRIVLMDFGAGRVRGGDAAAVGTPMYLAPEVLAGAPPSAQTDIYSLGVLLFHLVTRSFPFLARDVDALRRAHANGARIHLRDLRPDLPDRLVDGIERALDSDPARRFQTTGAMERALTPIAEAERPSQWWLAGAIAAGVVGLLAASGVIWSRLGGAPPIRSLAVLPFTETRPDTAHLTSGIWLDVLRELQRFDVQVRRGVALAPGDNPQQFDKRLGADAVVSAETERGTSSTRFHVQVRRASAAPFWVEDYEIPDGRLPAAAKTIAENVARAVRARPREGRVPSSHQISYRAYDAYQRGRALSEQRNPSDLMRSLEYFKQAASLDPVYAEPWAGMADSYLALGVPPFGPLRPMEARRFAKEAALKALALNPNLVEAETSLAWGSALYDWDWDVAERRFQRAITLNPQYALAHHWYAMFLTDMGRFREARDQLRQAQELEPLSLLIHRDFGWIDFCDGRYDEAIGQLRETLNRDPRYSAAITLLARALAAKGQTREALEMLERARTHISPGSYLSFRGYIEAVGNHPGTRRTLSELRRIATQEYVTPYYFALLYTALGDHDTAISELQRAYVEQDATLGSVNVDPRFAPLRADARFQSLVAAMRFPGAKQ